MHDSNGLPVETGVMTRKRRKGIYILPNLFTLAALFGGFYAVVMAMDGRFDQAAIGIFCAMVLDSLDGRVAHDEHTKCLRRANGLAVRHGVVWRRARIDSL